MTLTVLQLVTIGCWAYVLGNVSGIILTKDGYQGSQGLIDAVGFVMIAAAAAAVFLPLLGFFGVID